TPAATLIMTRLRGGMKNRGKAVTATLMSMGVVALMWVSLGGRSGLGEQETELQFLGCLLAVVSGVGQAITVTLSAELAQDKVPAPVTVLLRFPLLALIGWGAMGIEGNLEALENAVTPGIVMGLLGIALPVFLVQYGLRRVPAYRATAMMSLAPILTVGMQLFDGRLTLSPMSLLGVLFITIIALVASRPRRQEREHV
ncbi:EamA family transporter, partial [Sphaerimonospora thailandensis]|uniref:EamA family transporter n=1 Tax=Sphaerimonospora thailandensis TaxID=795644 RepID=UPI0019525CCA